MRTITKVLIVIAVMMNGCSMDGTDKYIVDEIHKQNGNLVLYELTEMNTLFGRYERIWDTVGKYQMGDTVWITLKKQ